MESQDLDKLFRDAMEHAQETPSSRVWEGIEQELKKENKVIPFHKKYRAQISIAAMFLLFFGIGLSLYKKPIPSRTEKVDKVIASIEQKKNISDGHSSSSNEYIEDKIGSSVSSKAADQNLSVNNNTLTLQDKPSVKQEEVYAPPQKKSVSHSEQEEIQLLTPDFELAEVQVELEDLVRSLHQEKMIDPTYDGIQPSFANSVPQEEVKTSLVTRVLNGITKNIMSKHLDMDEKREIEFRNDEEGSLSINIINSFARK